VQSGSTNSGTGLCGTRRSLTTACRICISTRCVKAWSRGWWSGDGRAATISHLSAWPWKLARFRLITCICGSNLVAERHQKHTVRKTLTVAIRTREPQSASWHCHDIGTPPASCKPRPNVAVNRKVFVGVGRIPRVHFRHASSRRPAPMRRSRLPTGIYEV
jgi:hypothetical protein